MPAAMPAAPCSPGAAYEYKKMEQYFALRAHAWRVRVASAWPRGVREGLSAGVASGSPTLSAAPWPRSRAPWTQCQRVSLSTARAAAVCSVCSRSSVVTLAAVLAVLVGLSAVTTPVAARYLPTKRSDNERLDRLAHLIKEVSTANTASLRHGTSLVALHNMRW